MDYWDTTFPEIADYVRRSVYRSTITDKVKKTVAKADVKAGKRLAAQCFAAYTNGENVINVFMSAYVRKADLTQREALQAYMFGGVYTINTRKHAVECKKALRELRRTYPSAIIVIHFDEFDHGSGSGQVLGTSGLWEYILSSDMIRVVQYSASPEEALLGEDESRRCIPMPTHPNYRGARYYLDSGLMREAEPPLRFSEGGEKQILGLGDQLLGILNDAREHVRTAPRANSRPFVVVRVTEGFAELQNAYQTHKLRELLSSDDDDVIVHCAFVASTASGTTKVSWDNFAYWQDEVRLLRRMCGVRVLFIDQMCTRSTDWFCHPFLFAYHDYHGDTSALNTIIQSNLRAAYYQGKKNDRGETVYAMEDHPIQLYGCLDVIEFVAGERTLDRLNRRVSSRAKVTIGDSGSWGRPMRFSLSPAVISDSRFTETLRDDEVRDWIKSQILTAPEITNAQRDILTTRQVQGKRNYRAHNTQGGIHTVHSRYTQGRESAPGGGIPDERVFEERDKYCWLDIAQEETNGIPAGTVYVTYGLLTDDEEEEEQHVHSLAQNRDGTYRSIFGARSDI
jgi:hypothetical protein